MTLTFLFVLAFIIALAIGGPSGPAVALTCFALIALVAAIARMVALSRSQSLWTAVESGTLPGGRRFDRTEYRDSGRNLTWVQVNENEFAALDRGEDVTLRSWSKRRRKQQPGESEVVAFPQQSDRWPAASERTIDLSPACLTPLSQSHAVSPRLSVSGERSVGFCKNHPSPKRLVRH